VKCIRNYIRLTVSLITIVLVIFILTTVNLAYESLQNNSRTEENNYEEIQKEETIVVIDEDEKIETLLKNTSDLNENLWQVEIPTISLVAPIAQDTTQEVMKKYVGHFTNTAIWKGNVGLAAHNRRIPN
jgi:sortase (surface protein transpeptidase)